MRLRRYSSTNNGAAVRNVIRPRSFSASSPAFLVAPQRVDVEQVVQLLHPRTRRAGRVLDRVGAAFTQRLVAEPAHHRVDVLGDRRRVVRTAEHVAPADVDVVGEAHAHRHRRHRFVDGAAVLIDPGDRRGEPARQHHDLVARAQDPARHLARVPAVVVVVVRHRADHVLHGEPHVDEVAVGADVDVLEVVQQRRAFVPRHVRRVRRDVVAVQRGDGHEREVVDVELRRELAELLADLVEALLRVVDEVHLVDAQHEVLHLEQRRDHRVPA